MRCLALLPFHLSLTILVFLHSLEGATANAVPYLDPGFEFSYNIPNQPFPAPVTSQCQRIQLSWSRTNNETGPSPVAPYFMQVYSSTSSVPYIVSAGFGPTTNWDVPFSPNTQYQICMFDTNGVSGGCQSMYTVIPNTTTTSPSCQLPPPPTALSVSATVPNGAMFQNSQINQCETLSVTPQSGSPPYTLTVAPVSHPPFNITSRTKDTISWQVALPVGFKFFLLLSSADGQMWANGPMSVGGLGGNTCFAPGTILCGYRSKSLFQKVVIGASVGGVIVGVVAALLGYLIFLKVQNRKRSPSQAYFARRHSRDNPAAPLKGSPSFAQSTSFGAFSSVPSSPTVTSIPLTPTTAVTNIPEVPPLPQELLTLPRRSAQRHRSVAPPSSAPDELGSSPSKYPADIKRPIPSNDDTESVASSSMNSRSHTRHASTHSRAPTYVPRSSQPRNSPRTAQESSANEMPPEYGRHTTDPYLKYAPSILSSGNRF